jgi:hypothetical protein
MFMMKSGRSPTPAPATLTPFTATARRMTDKETEMMIKQSNLNKMRIALVVLGALSLIFAFINLTYYQDTICVFTLVIMIVTIAVSSGTLQMRRAVSNALKDGNIVDVVAVVTRAPMGKGLSIGPATAPMPTPEFRSRAPEGQQAKVSCIPKFGYAVAINDAPLAQPVRVTLPSDFPPQQPASQSQVIVVTQTYQVQQPQAVKCGRCGTDIPASNPYCGQCGAPRPPGT